MSYYNFCIFFKMPRNFWTMLLNWRKILYHKIAQHFWKCLIILKLGLSKESYVYETKCLRIILRNTTKLTMKNAQNTQLSSKCLRLSQNFYGSFKIFESSWTIQNFYLRILNDESEFFTRRMLSSCSIILKLRIS